MVISYLPDVLRSITGLHLLFYAEDLVLFAEDTVSIDGHQVLHEWSKRNGININLKDTNVMQFRKGECFRKADTFQYGTEKVIIDSSYNYLGKLLQPTFTLIDHTWKRKHMPYLHLQPFKELPLVSVTTALRIFQMKILLIVTYGFDSISPDLTLKHLLEIDQVKILFLLKNALATLTLHLVSSPSLNLTLHRSGFTFSKATW